VEQLQHLRHQLTHEQLNQQLKQHPAFCKCDPADITSRGHQCVTIQRVFVLSPPGNTKIIMGQAGRQAGKQEVTGQRQPDAVVRCAALCCDGVWWSQAYAASPPSAAA